jgi:Ca-activated chloride channel family protein
MGGVETDLTYPREMPDIFRGSQVTLIGRYTNRADLRDVTLRLTGRTGNQTRTFDYANVNFPINEERNDFLPRLWATRRVGWLMEQIRTNGEQKELTDEIVDLGTRYGIVTPYTSYLALEESAQVTAADAARPVTSGRTVRDLPAQRRGAGAGNASSTLGGMAESPPPAPKEAAKATTGEYAVRESKRARAQQEATRADEDDRASSAAVSKVGDKTFYMRDGVWVDSEFKADAKLPETTLEFGGDEYFALIKREPQLARFFALGERVVVVYKGRVYRVNVK